MIVRCIWEHNGNRYSLYAENPAGRLREVLPWRKPSQKCRRKSVLS